MAGAVSLGRPGPVVFRAEMPETSWKPKLTRLFWQVVQVVVFPVGIYRYFSQRVPYSAKKAEGVFRRQGFCNDKSLHKRVGIKTSDGVRLDMWKTLSTDQKEVPVGEQRWLLILNREGECYEKRLCALDGVAKKSGVNILTGNYRGVGQSRGYQWSDGDVSVDAEAQVQYLLSLGVREENIQVLGIGFKEGVGRTLQANHPQLVFSEETRLSMSPAEHFKVTSDVFKTYSFKNVVTRLFWEVVYFVLLPLEVVRYVANRFAILPAVFMISGVRADQVRTNTLKRIRESGSELQIKRIAVTTADRVKLDTFELVHPNSPAEAEQKWIVLYNGNGASTEGMLADLAKIAEDTGANVYSGNYRGVGHSEGFPWTSQDLILDGEAMVQRLLTKGVKPENILIHGWSMGGGIGAAVAAKHPGMHLCSDRSFSGFDREVAEMIGGIAPQILRQLTSWKAETIQKVANAVTKIASRLVHFLGWIFDSVGNYEKVTGHKFVMHHPCDGVIPHKASLYYGLKQAHMTEADRLAKRERVRLQDSGERAEDEYATDYKPSRIRLHANSEVRELGWRSKPKGSLERATAKLRERRAHGPNHHCSAALTLSRDYSEGYSAYVAHVREALRLA